MDIKEGGCTELDPPKIAEDLSALNDALPPFAQSFLAPKLSCSAWILKAPVFFMPAWSHPVNRSNVPMMLGVKFLCRAKQAEIPAERFQIERKWQNIDSHQSH